MSEAVNNQPSENPTTGFENIKRQILVVYRERDSLEGCCAGYYLATLLENDTTNVVVRCLETELSFYEISEERSTTVISIGYTFDERYLSRLAVIPNPKLLLTLDQTLNNSPLCTEIIEKYGIDNISLPTLAHFVVQKFVDDINEENGKERVIIPLPAICKIINSKALYNIKDRNEMAMVRMVLMSLRHEVPSLRNWRLIFKMNFDGLVKQYKDFGEKMLRYSNWKNSYRGGGRF